MNRLVLASTIVAAFTVSAYAQQQNHNVPTTGAGSSLTSGASTLGQHQQGQAYIQGTNGCSVSMWLDPSQIKGGGHQVETHNCQ